MGGYYTPSAGDTITAQNWKDYVRDQTVNQFATTATRAAAISSPAEGMVSAQADADSIDLYDSSSGGMWVPTPVVTDALTVTAASPVVSAQAFGSEAVPSTKMQLVIPQVRTGELWLIGYSFLHNQSAAGSEWLFRLREDSVSGTVIGMSYLPNVGTTVTPFTVTMPWSCGANATSKIITPTLLRNAGAQTINLFNTVSGAQTMFAWAARVGRNTKYRSVA